MPEFSGLNYINVGPHGSFTSSGHLATTPADIDAIFNHLHATNQKKLAIHFHGGLIDEGAGLDIARKMAPLYSQAGCHPVTFVWETGLVETISRNLQRLHETTLFQKLVTYVIRHVGKRLGGGIGDKGPGQAMGLDEIEQELRRLDAFDRFDLGARGGAAGLEEADLPTARDEIEIEVEQELAADVEFSNLVSSGMAETEHLKPEVRGPVAPGSARGLLEMATLAKAVATVAFKVLQRYVKGIDHGFYPTVVEETLRELYLADFGMWVWQGMKDAGSEMWLPNPPAIDEKSHVGTYFLEKLSAFQQNRHLTLDLIGHSAGAIAICEMYKAAAARALALNVRNLLLLAPACRSDLFLAEIVEKPARFSAFRMFTMSDEWERKDQLVPGVYTRSLLYFISGVLENSADVPIAGLARHQAGEGAYDTPSLLKIRQWLCEAGKQRLALAKTGPAGAGLATDAFRHGDFDDDLRTRESLKAILAS